MQTTFSLKAEELNSTFLNILKKIAADHDVDIIVKTKDAPYKTDEVPNAETIAAIEESRSIISGGEKGTQDARALFARLDAQEF